MEEATPILRRRRPRNAHLLRLHVAEVTGHFHVPRQRIILWRGSEKDKTDAFVLGTYVTY